MLFSTYTKKNRRTFIEAQINSNQVINVKRKCFFFCNLLMKIMNEKINKMIEIFIFKK